MPTPEQEARYHIDRMLSAAGWAIQNAAGANLSAGRGIALREFPLKAGHGYADYLLYLDGKACGVIEAKKEGTPLTGVEIQSTKYSQGLPGIFPAHLRPLPFCYESTGIETRFTNGLDPEPRSRPVFHFHRPDGLAAYLQDLAQLPPIGGQSGEAPTYVVEKAVGLDGTETEEIVMFMRVVRSRTFFEQMKGRGVRVINPTDLLAVTPDAKAKERFVILDCVGVCEQELSDTRPLDRDPSIPFEKLLQAVAFGSTDPVIISTLASRLARLDHRLGRPEHEALAKTAKGRTLQEIAAGMIAALDPDRQSKRHEPRPHSHRTPSPRRDRLPRRRRRSSGKPARPSLRTRRSASSSSISSAVSNRLGI